MPRKISSPEFWSDRLTSAISSGNLESAVYNTTASDWKIINKQHQKFLDKYIKKEDLVLDAGCGYGRASTIIPGKYVGVDFSKEFIQLARKLYPDKAFCLCDLNHLDFQDKTFDWCIAISIREMIVRELGISYWLKIYRELNRVTKKGIIILEYGNKSGTTLREVLPT